MAPKLELRLVIVICMQLTLMISKAHSVPSNYYPVAGTVKDDAGEPVVDAQVQAFLWWSPPSESGSGASAHSVEYTDKAGSFTLHLPNDGSALVSASSPGLVTDYQFVEQKGPTLDFVLRKDGRKLSGTIVDNQERPVPFAQVAVDAKINHTNSAIKRLLLGSHFHFDLIADREGRIDIEDLPALPIRVYSVPRDSKDRLQQIFRETLKEPTVDLTHGDALNVTIRSDE